MAPLLMAALAAGAGLVGWKVLHPAPRYVGDLAKAGTLPSADQVEVSIANLLKSNSSVQQAQIPSGTMTCLVSVLGANKDVLQGPIIAWGSAPLPAPAGLVVVNRADVLAVIRGGKVARSPAGNFAGEKYKRFAG